MIYETDTRPDYAMYPRLYDSTHSDVSSLSSFLNQGSQTTRKLGPFERNQDQMPLLGVAGNSTGVFYAIHITALTSLLVSILVCLFVIWSAFLQHRYKTPPDNPAKVSGVSFENMDDSSSTSTTIEWQHIKSFWTWNVGERLVVYLAINDMGYSVFHVMDKAYIIHIVAMPPDTACSAFGFFFHEFYFAQMFIVLSTALGACSLVVFNKRIEFGRWDWRLLTAAFGIPMVAGAVALPLGLLGQSGAWCFVDLRSQAGVVYGNILSGIQLACIASMVLAYGAIWIKIRRTHKVINLNVKRYRSTASIMLILVLVFILQWWALIFFNAWTLAGSDPIEWWPIVTGCLCNLGGVWDCIAYTVIRRRIRRNESANGPIVMGCDGPQDLQREEPERGWREELRNGWREELQNDWREELQNSSFNSTDSIMHI